MASKKQTKGRKNSTKKRNTQQDKGIRLEIVLCVILAVSVILFISNFGLAGKAGRVISSFTKGIFGVMAYPFPVVLFFGYAFYVANRQKQIIVRKMFGLILLFIFITALFQLLISGAASSGDTVKSYYYAAEYGAISGGAVGGMIVWLFSKVFGFAGALVLIIIGTVISLVILTQRPLVTNFREKSGNALRNANSKRRERRIERQTEKRRIEERRRASEKRSSAVPERTALPEREYSGAKTFKTDYFSGFDIFEEDERDYSALPLVSRGHIDKKLVKAPAYEEIRKSEAPEKTADKPKPSVRPQREEPEGIQLSIPGLDDTGNRTDDVRVKETEGNSAKAVKKRSPSVKNASPDKEKAKAEELELSTITKEKSDYILPSPSLLTDLEVASGDSREYLLETAQKLKETLRDFGVNVNITNVSRGPAVTRYEFQPEHGVKVSKILSLSDDIKLNLAAQEIRIEAPIAGKAAVGIEVPNKEISMVPLKSLIECSEFKQSSSKLSFCVGKDIAGKPVIGDIQKMPHLLIAGATGSGKSVFINTLVVSILFKARPDEVKMIMIDPKVVELSVYNGIPHLLLPVVTDPRKAAGALNWAVGEMTRRYKLFSEFPGVKDLKGYNLQVKKKLRDPDITEEEKAELKVEPQILIIVDELADLMMVAQGEVEAAIVRITQLARAAGIHLVVATQRPSVNVITGLIKANMPSRIAFAVSSGVDSRTIIDQNGAEKLIGNGDMLYSPQGIPKPLRVQGSYIPDDDVSRVVEALSQQRPENEEQEIDAKTITQAPAFTIGEPAKDDGDDRDQYFWDAGKFVIEKDKGSIGMLQRVFKIGFNRAARIMDQLCEAGVVAGEEGTKPRKILMTMEEFEAFRESENSKEG